jgi:type II secretory pathway pseudopilin PulG
MHIFPKTTRVALAMKISSHSGMRSSAQAGDTIVEVLIAMAIVSLVLVGAFVTSNKSTQATRDSQEHAEATQDIKTQIELARLAISSVADQASDPTSSSTKLFCIVQTGTSATIVPFDTSGYANNGASLLTLSSDTFQSYPATCHQSAGGYSYYIVIENHITNPTNVPANTLLAHARWDNLGGGRDEVSFAYRAHAALPRTNGNAATVCINPDYTANAITRDPDFQDTLPDTPAIKEATGNQFTSDIPYRADSAKVPFAYPDDNGIHGDTLGQMGYLGGFSVFHNKDVRVSYSFVNDTGPPYAVWGQPLPNNSVPGKNITSYFYSNPVQALADGRWPSKNYSNSSFDGIIWSESNITVTPGQQYQFQMWVSNIKVPDGSNGQDPLIELKILDGSTVLADVPGLNTGQRVQYAADTSRTIGSQHPATWKLIPLNFKNTTSTNVTLQILDHAGKVRDDDFTMTALGLYPCQ